MKIKQIIFIAILLWAVHAGTAQANHFNKLLAPKSVCPNQGADRILLPKMDQSIGCMHRYARRKVGSRNVLTTTSLQRSSKRKAMDIRDCEDFSHSACGREPFFWVRHYGFIKGNCYRVGENIAFGSGHRGRVRQIMGAWLHSRSHRENLLNRSHKRIGISAVRAKEWRGYSNIKFWVSHMGYRC